ncbi:XS domain-containing protein [Dioscorea alata]|uniref:XS domain-containing protein n=1 Tax=Dioscorea alata TaxID=55571 RepID=A0ACB7UZX9_DIOAL|nr:XS domain-containing protein [Dioscorea alata]
MVASAPTSRSRRTIPWSLRIHSLDHLMVLEGAFDKRFPPPPHPLNAGRFSPNDFREPPLPFRRDDYWSSLGLDGPRASEAGPSSMKRKYGEEDEFARHRQSVLQYGSSNPNGLPSGSGGDRGDFTRRGGSPHRRDYHDDSRMVKQARFEAEGYNGVPPRRGRRDEDFPVVAVDVDPKALKRAFLKFAKIINENLSQRKNYLEDGKIAPLQCIVCSRASKDFADVHELVLHAYTSQNAELRVDHLGLHKALCVLMGWNYAKAPDYSKAYQSLSADDVAANREDLIVWPPTVIIHNTNSGRRKDGRMEGMGNKEMDTKLKDLGFSGGKSKSMYGKEGHMGMTLVKFANTQAGLKEAEHLSEYFEKDNHGRKGWSRAQAMSSNLDDDKNPAMVKLDEKTGEKKRILYGYLVTASDLDKVDQDTRKRLVIKSRKEHDSSD